MRYDFSTFRSAILRALSTRTGFYLLLFACLAPTLLLRDYTPANELRYLSISDEALREGHLLAFTLHGNPYPDKPPLYFWILMLIHRLTGAYPMWLVSMASWLPAVLTVEVLAEQFRLPRRDQLTFRLLTFTTGLFVATAAVARMDMLMTLFITLSLLSFYHAYESDKPYQSWTLPLFLFLGVFSKGALGLVLPLSVIIAFLCVKGQLSLFPKFFGRRSWAILIALFGLWFCGVYIEGGGAYLYDLVFHQTIGRTFHSFHHAQPVTYYLWLFWIVMLPWSFLMGAALWKGLRSYRFHDNGERFLVVATVSIFVVLSLVSAKLSVYLLPLTPFACLLAARYVCDGTGRLRIVCLAIPSSLLLLVLPAAIVAHLSGADWGRQYLSPCVWTAAVLIFLAALLSLLLSLRNRCRAGMEVLSTGILVAALFVGADFPRLNDWIGYRNVAEKALTETPDNAKVLVYHVKHGDNMDVFLHERMETVDEKYLQTTAPEGQVVILPVKDAGRFRLDHIEVVGPLAIGRTTRY
ncbi:MAG: ArnT family glycosyltransferase [Prevotella sp.]|jgi:4-amino-4-deoxy-L-arabinose transferase-like glycosyltransferase